MCMLPGCLLQLYGLFHADHCSFITAYIYVATIDAEGLSEETNMTLSPCSTKEPMASALTYMYIMS